MRYLCALLIPHILAQTPAELMKASLEQQRAAIAKQQESVRKQAATAGVRLISWDVAEPTCDPLPESTVAPLIDAAATAQKLEPKLLRAVMEQESALRPCAVSAKGAQGLMQLMPATAQQFGLQNPFDPQSNIQAGAKFLKTLIEKYKGDLGKALGAYNAGPAAVDATGTIPEIPETRDYVDAILKKLDPTRTVQPSTPKPKPIEN